MTYKHKSKNQNCTILDSNDGFVIYQYVSGEVRYTNKVRLIDFESKWELLQ